MSFHYSVSSRLASAAAALLLLTVGGCANRVSVNNGLERLFLQGPEYSTPLTSAGMVYDRLESDQATPADRAIYNIAVASLVSQMNPAEFFTNGSGLEEQIIEPPQAPITLRFANETEGADWNPSDFQSLMPADFLKIRGIRSKTFQFGVGAPLVGRLSEARETAFTRLYGAYLPVTAVVDFDDEARVATIRLMDPLKDAKALIAGDDRQLEADFTAPLASALAARKRQRLNLPAMVNFEKFKLDLGGLTQVDPVYPDKIPVVFIHGLKSNPDTWRDVLNELRAYPEIRERYEFWIFGYATGAPMPYTARRLRMDLQEMQTFRQHRGAPTDDVVLIGHSMGGIMARLMTQRSGDEQWFQVFNRPADELDLPASQRELLKELFYFEPLPFVNEVAFISTPHRGSDLAENPIGQLGAKLIQLPANLIELSANLVQGSFAALTPEGRQLLSEMPNSIQQLSASSEFMKVSAQDPLSSDVIYHSIIGDRGKPGPLEESSDGVVPYWSAHRDEAVSEVIVPAGHGAHQHPEAIAEIARILIAH